MNIYISGCSNPALKKFLVEETDRNFWILVIFEFWIAEEDNLMAPIKSSSWTLYNQY